MHESLRQRRSAKVAIRTEGYKYLFVVSPRGMINLPGGGIKKNETPHQASLRELQEEIGLDETAFSAWKQINADDQPLEGIVTTRTSQRLLAKWSLYETSLLIPISEIVIPDSDEVANIIALSASGCYSHPAMSTLAQQAIRLVEVAA
jgi:8-oxo-dGTP pyrophosphatase MutT (NUDIX family)